MKEVMEVPCAQRMVFLGDEYAVEERGSSVSK